MPEHIKFEELCALAATGHISSEEFAECSNHLKDCAVCKDLHGDLLDINAIWLTQAQELEPEMYDQQHALRNKIFGTLRGAGARFSREAQERVDAPRIKFGILELIRIPSPAWAMAALALITAFLGFEAGTREYTRHADGIKAAPGSVSAPTARPLDADGASNGKLTVPASQGNLEQRLEASESERTKALADMQVLRRDIAALQNSRDQNASQVAELKDHSEQDQNATASAQAQLRSLKEAEDAKNADLVATQIQLRELEGKLAEQRAAADRAQALAEVSSSSEMRDVIASRNLHIIDVADVTNNGVQKPFGRIFYTEGKSLIFYAYDLAGAKGTKTFYAWGHREGDANTTRALGSLHLDDPAQRRWVFKSNDAKVLAQIDSVYVTLEPTAKPGEKPEGHKILTAFLGTQANHP
jgi:hypothetical protein